MPLKITKTSTDESHLNPSYLFLFRQVLLQTDAVVAQSAFLEMKQVFATESPFSSQLIFKQTLKSAVGYSFQISSLLDVPYKSQVKHHKKEIHKQKYTQQQLKYPSHSNEFNFLSKTRSRRQTKNLGTNAHKSRDFNRITDRCQQFL
jgi:hypothetical protein